MTLTHTEKEWIATKDRELIRVSQEYPGDVVRWDIYHFMNIVHKLQRENRRLKTQINSKEIK